MRIIRISCDGEIQSLVLANDDEIESAITRLRSADRHDAFKISSCYADSIEAAEALIEELNEEIDKDV